VIDHDVVVNCPARLPDSCADFAVGGMPPAS